MPSAADEAPRARRWPGLGAQAAADIGDETTQPLQGREAEDGRCKVAVRSVGIDQGRPSTNAKDLALRHHFPFLRIGPPVESSQVPAPPGL